MDGQLDRQAPDDQGLILELLELPIEEPGPPISRAERIASEFHRECVRAISGKKLTENDFVKSPDFSRIMITTRQKVGPAMANKIAGSWFYNNQNFFTAHKNVQ